ncbi:MAG: dTMP kinase [Actinomycetota bacterium]|nr:dTMP kinase [Actinomycetota bacterium]
MRGRFVALEGVEGAGKSTQARLLAERLDAVLTREPGATGLGARIRELVLDADGPDVGVRAEALLMAADRAQHVEELVRPTVEAGRHVVSDRYLYSSVAYQGHGRGLPPDEVRRLSEWATDGFHADLVVLVEVPVELGASRLAGPRDRIERSASGFWASVADGFRAQAEADPARWAVVDGAGPVEAVARSIAAVVDERLGLGADTPGGAHP